MARRIFKRRDAGAVASERDELQAARRAYVAECGGVFRETIRQSADQALEEARARLAGALESRVRDGRFPVDTIQGFGPGLADLAGLWAATQPGFAKELHAAVDGLPADLFAPVARAEFDATLAELDEKIDALEKELDLIRASEVVDQRQRELEQAEHELASIEGGGQ